MSYILIACAALVVIAVLLPLIRIVVVIGLIGLVIYYFSSGSDTPPTPQTKILSYQELKDYPKNCEKADEQLAELQSIQKLKNFSADPDKLSESDRLYNARLKDTIWWFSYKCNKSDIDYRSAPTKSK